MMSTRRLQKPSVSLTPLLPTKSGNTWTWTAELGWEGSVETLRFPGPKQRAIQIYHEFGLRVLGFHEHPRAVVKWLNETSRRPWTDGALKEPGVFDLISVHPGARSDATANDYATIRAFATVVGGVLCARGQLAQPVYLPCDPPLNVDDLSALGGVKASIINTPGFTREYQEYSRRHTVVGTEGYDVATRSSAKLIRAARRMFVDSSVALYNGAGYCDPARDEFMDAPLEEPAIERTLPPADELIPALHAALDELEFNDEYAFTCAYLALHHAYLREEGVTTQLVETDGSWQLCSNVGWWGRRQHLLPGWLLRRHVASGSRSFFLLTPRQRSFFWDATIELLQQRSLLADCEPMRLLRDVSLDYLHSRFSPFHIPRILGLRDKLRLRGARKRVVASGFFPLWEAKTFSPEPAGVRYLL